MALWAGGCNVIDDACERTISSDGGAIHHFGRNALAFRLRYSYCLIGNLGILRTIGCAGGGGRFGNAPQLAMGIDRHGRDHPSLARSSPAVLDYLLCKRIFGLPFATHLQDAFWSLPVAFKRRGGTASRLISPARFQVSSLSLRAAGNWSIIQRGFEIPRYGRI